MAIQTTSITLSSEDRKILAALRNKLKETQGEVTVTQVFRMALRAFAKEEGLSAA